MRLFQRLFYQPKHKERTTGERSICRLLAPSVISIFICAICLCGASWAWFTASTSTGTTQIQSSSYKLVYQIGEDTTATELAETGSAYTLTADRTVITLKATGTAGATGYCSITVDGKTYYTEQIFVNDTSAFTFTVNAAAGTTITLTPKWGTYSGTATIQNKGEITATGSQQNTTQTPDNSVTAEPSTEPVTTPDTTGSTTGVPDTTGQAKGSTTSADNTGTEDTD